jgi:hypothetical protein
MLTRSRGHGTRGRHCCDHPPAADGARPAVAHGGPSYEIHSGTRHPYPRRSPLDEESVSDEPTVADKRRSGSESVIFSLACPNRCIGGRARGNSTHCGRPESWFPPSYSRWQGELRRRKASRSADLLRGATAGRGERRGARDELSSATQSLMTPVVSDDRLPAFGSDDSNGVGCCRGARHVCDRTFNNSHVSQEGWPDC